MITICTLLAPFVNSVQQIVNVVWFPLTFFGSPVPSVGSVLGGFLGCTF